MSTTNNVNYSIRTAHETFYYANLSGITTLNLNNAVFAATDMSNGCSIYTADNTFFVANMPSILSLNFDGAIFAATNMMKQTVANNYLRTAYDTFLQAFLGQLTVIDFRDAILYIDQTYSAATSTPCYQTFYDARLVCLTDIYLPSTTSYTSNTA
jgi:hypothetical protein